MKKGIVSLILATCLITSMMIAVPAVVLSAASGQCGDNLIWTLDEDGTLTIRGTGDMWNWKYGSVPWYSLRNSISNVIIKNGVTSIGDFAFEGCGNISLINMPNGITSIGNSAFDLCVKLTNITMPNTLSSIGNSTFYGCSNITNINIPNSVINIGDGAFVWCNNLSSISFPAGITSIGNSLFDWCTSLTSIEVDPNNPSYSSLNGNLYNKDRTKLIQYAIGKEDGSFTVPNGVTSIENSAFVNCYNLTNINIPNSVIKIGNSAFNWCNGLTSIEVAPNNSIYSSLNGDLYDKDKTILIKYAIGKEDSSFTVPNSVIRIGDNAFEDCFDMTAISISNNVKYIGNNAFTNCYNLTNINMPNSVINIGNGVFDLCDNLTNIEVDPNNPNYSSLNGNLYNKDRTKLIQYAIGKKDGSFTIPNSVTSLENYAFYSCRNLTSITIPESVINIGCWTFYYCSSLTNITIPNGITSIGEGGFSDCNNLTSIVIPDSVTSIGNYAFSNCENISNVYYCGSAEKWEQISIGRSNADLTSATIHYNYASGMIRNIFVDNNTVNLTLKNISAQAYDSVCLIVGVYERNGWQMRYMKSVILKDFSVGYSGDIQLLVEKIERENVIKNFLWNSFKGITPLAKFEKIRVSSISS